MLIANKSFAYDGHRLRAGDEFEPKNSGDERLLTAIKHARPAEPKPRKARKTYMTRDMVAAEAETPAVSEYFVPAITGESPAPESMQQTAVDEPDSDALMRLFGLQITKAPASLSPVFGQGAWSTIFDSTPNGFERDRPPGQFQANKDFHNFQGERLLSFNPVYSCITLIANDIGKLSQRLVQVDEAGLETETTSPSFSPVLAAPNGFQNHVQFKQWWIMSKLDHGNTYALKGRDNRGVVTSLFILDPRRCHPLVAPDGTVYYQLGEDNLSGLMDSSIIVPASEVIHDRMNCLFHPLIGTSPMYAAALAAAQGQGIQRDSLAFFANGSSPSGVLTAPGQISDATAKRAKEYWDSNFGGRANSGKVAVLGDDLKFQPMRMTSVDSQTSDQLKNAAVFICSAFHVPPFKIGLADIPVRQTVSDLNQIYYSDCLDSLIGEYELCMSQGLALPAKYSIELDIDGLLRMDQATLITTLGMAVDKTLMTPNEARLRLNLPAVTGGDSLYKQQQEYSLAALDARDRANPAPSSSTPAAKPADPSANPPPDPVKAP